MTECQTETMQEQLPLLVRGTLSTSDAAVLRAHIAACGACAEELTLLERTARLFDQATPHLDTAAILAKLPAAPGARPALTVSRGARRTFAPPRYALAAAASLLLIATLSVGALRDTFFGGSARTDNLSDSNPTLVAALAVGLVGGNELGELGVDDLEMLLQELDQFEATIAAEPMTMQRPVSGAPEGL